MKAGNQSDAICWPRGSTTWRPARRARTPDTFSPRFYGDTDTTGGYNLSTQCWCDKRMIYSTKWAAIFRTAQPSYAWSQCARWFGRYAKVVDLIGIWIAPEKDRLESGGALHLLVQLYLSHSSRRHQWRPTIVRDLWRTQQKTGDAELLYSPFFVFASASIEVCDYVDNDDKTFSLPRQVEFRGFPSVV